MASVRRLLDAQYKQPISGLFHALSVAKRRQAPMDKPTGGATPLYVTLLCKFYTDTPVSSRQLDKFFLTLPYVVVYSIPVSFLGLVESGLLESSGPEARALLVSLTRRPILKYGAKGSDVTNQQVVSFVKYLAATEQDVGFFRALNRTYMCVADAEIMRTPFEDYVTQENINVFKMLDLNRLLDMTDCVQMFCENMRIRNEQPNLGRFCVSDTGSELERECADCSFFSLVAKTVQPLANTSAYYQLVQRLWRELTAATESLAISDLRFTLCTYDIEVGFQSRDEVQNNLATIFNGECPFKCCANFFMLSTFFLFSRLCAVRVL